MIWGGIGYQFKTDLVIIEGTLNSEDYIEQIIFGSNLIEEADKKYGIGEWTHMQDNARPHISKETMCVLNELEINILKDWPPYSPDLNIIEVVWAIMETRVEALQPKTINDLVKIVKDVWEALQWQTINGLVMSISKRLRIVNATPDRTIFRLYGDPE
ncbi:Transposable element Tc3 transposase [Histomonas meleagridis]|uniref:Transposable element Tc3 transposase n=1 Tax=Histomonas meleagridis TaxID=135588 RepID=UPI0035595C9D|nr:Transposable element Tc3 transposase [Histomonas meleagridis]KAH0799137.1 Transposable element Tc3 transposase [Histomonas meleagridis]